MADQPGETQGKSLKRLALLKGMRRVLRARGHPDALPRTRPWLLRDETRMPIVRIGANTLEEVSWLKFR